MSAHNEALRMAQNLIRNEAARLPQVEIGYQQYSEHPDRYGMERAAELIGSLVLDTPEGTD